MIGDGYILQIAQESQNAVVVGLNGYLFTRLVPRPRGQLADRMLTAITLSVLGWPTGDLLPEGFVEEHKGRIDGEAKALAKDERLCEVLSGAVYNIGYGHYVKAGGGRLVNRYLGFVRADRRRLGSRTDAEVWSDLCDKLTRLDPTILLSYFSLLKFKLWRPRSDNPNERDYYNAIYNFANEAKEQRALIARQQTMAVKPAPRNRTQKSERSDGGYPTRAEIKELMEAHQTGKPGAIGEILRKRAAENAEQAARHQNALHDDEEMSWAQHSRVPGDN